MNITTCITLWRAGGSKQKDRAPRPPCSRRLCDPAGPTGGGHRPPPGNGVPHVGGEAKPALSEADGNLTHHKIRVATRPFASLSVT